MRRISAAAVFAIVAAAVPAHADTRADALDRAAHCNALPEGHLWLDCFYGAAEPARALVGLPSAPQAQQFASVYAGPMPQNPVLQDEQQANSSFFDIFGSGKKAPPPQAYHGSDTRGIVMDRAQHCIVLPEGRLWLDCFYGAAQPIRAALNLPAAPQATQFTGIYTQQMPDGAVTREKDQEDNTPGLFDLFASPNVPVEQFGFRNAKPGPGVNVDRVVDRIVNVQTTKNGFIITLANGQVWKQTDDTPIIWKARGEAYSAIITHGAIDSFNFHRVVGRSLEDQIYRVQRVK